MALKIIGAGFGRTGTLSVCHALNQVGFPCYHMYEVIENKQNIGHLDFWRRVAHSEPGAQHDWEQVFARYTATVDNPGCCVWRELMMAYPEAKVLLTLHPRGPDTWYESTIETIYAPNRMWQFALLRKVLPFAHKFGDMVNTLIWQRSHRGTMEDRTQAIALYQQHIADVKAAVPPERLLVFSVDQGWRPLCDFLSVPVPDTPFPNVNDRATMQKHLQKMRLGAYGILGIALLALGSLAYAALHYL